VTTEMVNGRQTLVLDLTDLIPAIVTCVHFLREREAHGRVVLAIVLRTSGRGLWVTPINREAARTHRCLKAVPAEAPVQLRV